MKLSKCCKLMTFVIVICCGSIMSNDSFPQDLKGRTTSQQSKTKKTNDYNNVPQKYLTINGQSKIEYNFDWKGGTKYGSIKTNLKNIEIQNLSSLPSWLKCYIIDDNMLQIECDSNYPLAERFFNISVKAENCYVNVLVKQRGGSFKVSDIQVGTSNTLYGSDIKYSTLYGSDIKYRTIEANNNDCLRLKLSYFNPRNIKKLPIDIKIIDSDGKYLANEYNEQHVFATQYIELEPAAGILVLSGIANPLSKYFSKGWYKIEIWTEGEKIFSKNFEISSVNNNTISLGLNSSNTSSKVNNQNTYNNSNHQGQEAFERGKNYELGIKGYKKSIKDALYWYEQAANEGHPIALANLGLWYFYGKNVKKDEQKGIVYMNRAVANGYGPGKRFLQEMLSEKKR